MLWRRLIKVVMNLREFIIILDRNGNILLIKLQLFKKYNLLFLKNLIF